MRIAVTATPAPARGAPLLLCGGLAEAFRQAAELGCDGVEIHMRRAEDVDLDLVRRLAADYRLTVPTLGTGMAAADGLSFADPDPLVRAASLERVRGHIGFAAEIGSAVTIGILSGNLGRCGDQERRRRRSQAIETLAAVCRSAESAGVTILLEPLNRYECDYINTLADGRVIAREIGARNLKLLADTFHMNIEEADPAAGLKAAGGLVGHVHLADTNRQAPGRGHLDVKAILEALDAIGYHGFLSLEVIPVPDAAAAIRGAMAAIRAAMPSQQLIAGGFQ